MTTDIDGSGATPCSTVYANSVWQTHSVDLEIVADRFWLKHGDNGSGDHQVRLDPDGSVYLGYTQNCRRDVRSVTLSFAAFDAAFRDFVDKCIAGSGNP